MTFDMLQSGAGGLLIIQRISLDHSVGTGTIGTLQGRFLVRHIKFLSLCPREGLHVKIQNPITDSPTSNYYSFLQIDRLTKIMFPLALIP